MVLARRSPSLTKQPTKNPPKRFRLEIQRQALLDNSNPSRSTWTAAKTWSDSKTDGSVMRQIQHMERGPTCDEAMDLRDQAVSTDFDLFPDGAYNTSEKYPTMRKTITTHNTKPGFRVFVSETKAGSNDAVSKHIENDAAAAFGKGKVVGWDA